MHPQLLTKPFDEKLTKEGDFYVADGSTKKVSMMSQSGKFEYLEEDAFQAIRIPYGQGKMSMDIFLPNENSNLQAFYEQLSVENWQKWSTRFKTEEGTIRLPRFQMEYEVSINDALKLLSMELAFDKNKANFQKMTSIPPNVYINEVKHKTFLEVNEEGTEAAAVTSIEMGVASAPMFQFEMNVNWPFFFVIRDQQSGSILFMGSILEPTE